MSPKNEPEHPTRENLEHARSVLDSLLRERQCLMLATADDHGMPDAGSLPWILHDEDFIIFASELAKHTRNLKLRREASILLMEDESECRQPFARKRLQFRVQAEPIEDPAMREALVAAFHERFGKVIDLLASLPDFRFFRLRVVSGTLVTGFGRAWNVSWPSRELRHITPQTATGYNSAPDNR